MLGGDSIVITKVNQEGLLNTGCAEEPADSLIWDDLPVLTGKDTVLTVINNIDIAFPPAMKNWEDADEGIWDFCIEKQEVTDTLPRLYVPNIFTPASGDANSVFSMFFNPQVTHLWTHIYDRWGTMVYRAEGAEPPRWDGTMNGKLMPPGVYAVVTALRPAGEAVQVLHRTVTLVR